MPARRRMTTPRRLPIRRLPAAPAEAAAHEHEEEAWAPADGFERFAYTALANIVTGIGFALILVAASEFAGGIANWRQGVFWGFAGFAVFTLAPGLGLPPELPAMPAADLLRPAGLVGSDGGRHRRRAGADRLQRNGGAVAARRGADRRAARHRRAAAREPRIADPGEPAPPVRGRRRPSTNLIFWVVLGGIVGVVRQRFLGAAGGFSRSFA